MLWPWSLIAENRRLIQDLESCHGRCTILEDRLEFAQSDRAKLWEMMQAALTGEREALRMQVNAAWQQKGFGTPYPESPSLPPQAEPTPGGGAIGRQAEMPNARVARQTSEFIQNMLADRKH
jgi:hypothetical protein